MNPRCITVSVVSHGHGDDVLRLLRQLAELAASQVERVIVTLNRPEPALAQALQRQPWPFALSRIDNPRPKGFAGNHNQAFAAQHSAYFCVINPDIALQGNPFPALLRALQTPQAGCAYPQQFRADGTLQDHQRVLPSPLALLRRYHLLPGPAATPAAALDWVNAAFLLFPQAVFAELGGFDAGYFMYCEDVDLSLRLQLRGYRLQQAADAHVAHQARRASHRPGKHLFWHLRSLLRLWRSSAYQNYRR